MFQVVNLVIRLIEKYSGQRRTLWNQPLRTVPRQVIAQRFEWLVRPWMVDALDDMLLRRRHRNRFFATAKFVAVIQKRAEVIDSAVVPILVCGGARSYVRLHPPAVLDNVRRLRQNHGPRAGGLPRGRGEPRIHRRVHQVSVDDASCGHLLRRRIAVDHQQLDQPLAVEALELSERLRQLLRVAGVDGDADGIGGASRSERDQRQQRKLCPAFHSVYGLCGCSCGSSSSGSCEWPCGPCSPLCSCSCA